MRHTSSHTKNRRSHHALTETNVVVDKESGAERLPHRLDETTGMYRGMQIVSKKEVKEKGKKRAKRVAKHEHEHVEGVKEPVHAVEEKKPKSEGLMGRMITGRAKSRSGFGGGA